MRQCPKCQLELSEQALFCEHCGLHFAEVRGNLGDGAPAGLKSNLEISGCDRLQDFHRWAFSDLCDDDVKGVFAEWMVRQLLRCPSDRRVSWADSDIILPSGISVELKSSAIWQSWKLVNQDGSRKNPLPLAKPVRPTYIRFGGLRARPTASQWSGEQDFKSHLYVFCFQCETDPAQWDAQNLEQWEFYVMNRHELIELTVGKSISLAALRKFRLCRPCSMLSPNGSMSAAQFQSFMQVYTRTWQDRDHSLGRNTKQET
jgi:hypothetical protein